MIVDDFPTVREALGRLVESAIGARVKYTGCNRNALEHLRRTQLSSEALDFVTTDICRPDGTGIELIAAIRALPPSVIASGCLRLSHVPIVVVSGSADPIARNRILSIDPNIRILDKPADDEGFLQAIIASVCDYRHRILSEFQSLGLSVYWSSGRYRVASAYAVPAWVNSEYLAGKPEAVGLNYSRLILVDACWHNAFAAVDLFEKMINEPGLDEREFQLFFQRHPEFLLAERYDSYWAEPKLASEATGQCIRPDFVLQPSADRTLSWNWSIVDLKRHDVGLLTGTGSYAALSRHVYRVVTQLQNYRSFFDDPRNHEALKRRFGGIIPTPRLTAIIGRLPAAGAQREVFSTLIRRHPEVAILTYDEVLHFRKTNLDRMRSMR